MCGIVGLFIKDPALEPELGTLVTRMLTAMGDRGPDSAGVAVYGPEHPGYFKVTLRVDDGIDVGAAIAKLAAAADLSPTVLTRDTHLTLSIPQPSARAFWRELARLPELSVVSTGRRMEIFKAVGRPETVAARFGLGGMAGTHAIGHTRMATELAVTTEGAHPFTTGPDQCLVHNGSLSNHNAVRRELIRHGLSFRTENDTEVAAGFITDQMRAGLTLNAAMQASLKALDGFYTFVVGTELGFSVLRDPIACKPAVMAETGQWVAFGTEYRALVDLPGVDEATVFEPEPAKVYVWERH